MRNLLSPDLQRKYPDSWHNRPFHDVTGAASPNPCCERVRCNFPFSKFEATVIEENPGLRLLTISRHPASRGQFRSATEGFRRKASMNWCPPQKFNPRSCSLRLPCRIRDASSAKNRNENHPVSVLTCRSAVSLAATKVLPKVRTGRLRHAAAYGLGFDHHGDFPERSLQWACWRGVRRELARECPAPPVVRAPPAGRFLAKRDVKQTLRYRSGKD